MKLVLFVLVGSILAKVLEKRTFWDREIVGFANMGNFVRYDGGGTTKGNFDGGPFRNDSRNHDR